MSSADPAPPLRTVQMFWHGAPLSRLERLSIASFLANGHPLDLYVYGDVGLVPAGARILDAAAVLPQKLLFRHRRTGSVAAFADWFRYRLLLEKGGIWADTDMVCLKPLDFAADEIFGWENEHYVNNAILGLPAGHRLAAWLADCCENPNRVLPYDSWALRVRKWRRRVLHGNRREKVRWGEYGPKGLTYALRYFGLADKALSREHFYPIAFDQWETLFTAVAELPPWMLSSHAVHFSNNQTSFRKGFDKNGHFAAGSPFERMCRLYL